MSAFLSNGDIAIGFFYRAKAPTTDVAVAWFAFRDTFPS
jgi:predicted solute-binding protein